LLADSMVTNFYQKIGTMGMADLQNALGGLPVRNFSAGQQVDVAGGGKFKMGGDHISQLNVSRGGEHTHACMPGCVIQCSNVYVDASRKEPRGSAPTTTCAGFPSSRSRRSAPTIHAWSRPPASP